ncbi:class D sortase [Metabacillus niabensis]|uniref:Sortase A n=1 Tax=Metabacillus niabensis TaxID=324854 RepID=A0ABT9Z708_9BACI|nr:class D sortase [Metabacillus niabensis]MDQ0228043.1 sortase A [Metabacillus niabensis]
MSRIIGFIATVLIIGGIGYSAWNLYQWNDSKKSVKAIDESQAITMKSTELQPKKALDEKSEKTIEDVSTLNYSVENGKKVAKLNIPKIASSFDVFWNTDESTLDKGVGMYVSEWTTIPNDIGGHTVLSGHRDTVFTKLGELKQGDTMTVEYEGESFTYKIKDIWITDANDRTVIVKKDKPTLTLTTCYPFDFIGSAPDRYIIQAELVSE